jgi:transcriptional regulator with XRE-family HTH domain
METIGDRLMILIKYLNYTADRMSKEIGVSKGAISKWLSNNAVPGSDPISKIILNHREISPYWLLLGEGDIVIQDYIKKESKEKSEDNEKAEDNEIIEAIRESKKNGDNYILSNDQKINKLIIQNEKLVNVIDYNTMIIGKLSKNNEPVYKGNIKSPMLKKTSKIHH